METEPGASERKEEEVVPSSNLLENETVISQLATEPAVSEIKEEEVMQSSNLLESVTVFNQIETELAVSEMKDEAGVPSNILETETAMKSEISRDLPKEQTTESTHDTDVTFQLTTAAPVEEQMEVDPPSVQPQVSEDNVISTILNDEPGVSEAMPQLSTDVVVTSTTSEILNIAEMPVPVQEPETDNKQELIQLSQGLNTNDSVSLENNLLPEDTLNEEQFTTTTDILHEATKNIQPSKWKPKSGSFSLGVPGLTFSAQNLKIANDGTKMVQIHQSQITPGQLEALQSNPNIKVVFRHIPSGKSFTKPPKNLFSSQSRGNGIKRKNREEEEEKGVDDSIYNFDDEFADFPYPEQPKSKVANTGSGNTKFARYNPNVGLKKRPGRPRLIPDANMIAGAMHSRPVLPTQIQLTDALVKLNKPGASHTVKVHVKQVTHDILINMELNPKYNIVLTAKHEVPPNHSLEELVKEWEEKETMDHQPQPQNESEEIIPAVTTHEQEDEKDEDDEEKEFLKAQERKKEEKRIKKEKTEEKSFSHQKWRQQQKEKEEAELLSAALLEKTSRSGRIRKPSRFSLDIARMTKRRSAYEDASPDDESFSTPAPPKRPVVKTPRSDDTPSDGQKKRGRGRPKKNKKEEADVSIDDLSPNKAFDKQRSPPPSTIEPRVMMSPTDKRLADILLEESNQLRKKNKTPVADKTVTEKEHDKSETECGEDVASKTTESEGTVTEKENEKSEKECGEDVASETTESVSENTATEKENDKSETECNKEAEPSDVECSEKSDEKIEEKPDEKMEEKSNTEESKQEEGSNMETEETTVEAKESEVSTPSDTTVVTETKPEASTNENTSEIMETEKVETNTDNSVVENNVSASKDNESPSDILARKLSKEGMDTSATADSSESKPEEPMLKDFVEEEGDVDNKYRLRKLLQQCSIEEIKSVAIPRALDIVSLGDFFLHKAGQMCRKKVNFTSLYNQLEDLHTCVEKESIRYSTLLRRANKVGGDRRMEKVILMPIYNKQAAESLHINSSSIDAHIGSIYPKPTTNMIAASSFHMNCKMDQPLRRLNLPELTDRTLGRKKRGGAVYSQPTKYAGKPGTDSSNIQRPYTAGRPRGSWKRSYQVRKPNYLLGDESNNPSATTLQEHARMQLANRYRAQLVAKESAAANGSNRQTTTAKQTQGDVITTLPTATDTTVQLNSTPGTELTPQSAELPPGTELMTEDGATIMAAEDGKQLVSIGDGQYVELPEGYTLIQTDDGYLIGQAGATFVQGDDGSVYMTSSVEGTELTDQQVLTTTAAISDPQSSEQILEQLTQG